MKKINLNGISEILSEKELKNVMGGSGGSGTCSKNNCVTKGTTNVVCYKIDGYGSCAQCTCP